MTTAHTLAHGWTRSFRGRRGDTARLASLVGGCAAVAATIVVSGGLLLAWRRASGALLSPPAPVALLAVTACAIALVAGCDAAVRLGSERGWAVAARCGLAIAVAALAVPGSWSPKTPWLPVAIATVASAAAILRPPPTGQAGASRRRPTVRLPAGPTTRRETEAGFESAAGPGSAPAGAFVRQRIERFEPAPGVDWVRARLVLAVTAGSKAAQGHVGFCPAFAETPAVEVTTAYDGVEATVTAAEVLPWGVRVECRLAEPAEESLDIPVDVSARGPA